ncbi:Transmembrane protein 242 [Trichoplax sp. H2]|uniref:Transmembrane protein 242 n=1 Tax=Trichoplax adhaerens TaxID=10228 RepID=B3RXS8_TRIAD|nr:hypothetical protein TRIADDRAFT_56316 [Trichoplax adhaerens]EDV24910.1 hypothetical protein TRIADDRAFT_56316 [Trichoplax adhaerens]RDD46746.1 Transmembrane protein 242 [Trichoplax sp. H2]|eukprot:XP_002112800.1 hypothetical protein TRIADDRAFT_56316 [Trichoplax adhaerens]
MEKETIDKTEEEENKASKFSFNTIALPVLVGISMVSILGGFGATISLTRRKHPDVFMHSQYEGGRLATRALGWATVISCGGFAMAIISVRTLFNVHSAKEFGDKMRSIMPSKDGEFVKRFEHMRLPRNNSISKDDDSKK